MIYFSTNIKIKNFKHQKLVRFTQQSNAKIFCLTKTKSA